MRLQGGTYVFEIGNPNKCNFALPINICLSTASFNDCACDVQMRLSEPAYWEQIFQTVSAIMLRIEVWMFNRWGGPNTEDGSISNMHWAVQTPHRHYMHWDITCAGYAYRAVMYVFVDAKTSCMCNPGITWNALLKCHHFKVHSRFAGSHSACSEKLLLLFLARRKRHPPLPIRKCITCFRALKLRLAGRE